MNIYISLDYELFFGSRAGTVGKCIVEPTDYFLNICDKYGVKANFFIDSGYIIRLEEEKKKHPTKLNQEWSDLTDNINKIAEQGHDIQLHIHPHWEDCSYNGQEWNMDLSRYRLADFDKSSVANIVADYKKVLERFAKNKINAYRAGGWCMQPFPHIKEALLENGVTIDSTVFRNGKSSSSTHSFDFKDAPDKTYWTFSDDPLKEDSGNPLFEEIPIASMNVSPLFYWKLAYSKLSKNDQHLPFGDGSAAQAASKFGLIKMLSLPSWSVVSIDGFKAHLLEKAYRTYKNKFGTEGNFVIIGHPKAFTKYSMEQFESFLAKVTKDNGVKFKRYSEK